MTRIDNPGDAMDNAHSPAAPRARNELSWRRAMEKAQIDGWFDGPGVHFRPQLVRLDPQSPRPTAGEASASHAGRQHTDTRNAGANTAAKAAMQSPQADDATPTWTTSPASVLAWRAAASANDAEGPSLIASQATGGTTSATPRSTGLADAITPALAPMAMRNLKILFARFDTESGAAPLSTRLVHAGASDDGVVLWIRDATIDAPARDNVAQRLREWARAHGVRISGIFFNGRRIYSAGGHGMLNDNA